MCDSRKYVDLIYKAESKFANWDPSHLIEAGDYGTLNRDTGSFEKDGNIYEDEVIPNIIMEYPLIEDNIIDHEYVHSSNAKERTIGIESLKANFVGLAPNVVIDLQFQFGKSRGALLVMHKVTAKRIPNRFLQVSTTIECLRGKMLVTKAVTCPGYVRYMSSKESESIGVTLTANFPTGFIPGLSVGGGQSFRWKTQSSTGNMQFTYHKELAYTPLFCAKKIKQPLLDRLLGGRRGEIDPNESQDDYWTDATVPWSTLDDEGREFIGRFKPREESESDESDED